MDEKTAIKWLENLKHSVEKPIHSPLSYYGQPINEIIELLKDQHALIIKQKNIIESYKNTDKKTVEK